MRKIGLILDSASGLTKEEANAKGHAFIPLQIAINNEVKKAGVDITLPELYDAMKDKKNVEIMTSLPKGEDIEAAFDWILERYETAIYVGISHKISGTQNAVRNVAALSEKYEGKIIIYESQYGSPWLNLYLDDFEWALDTYGEDIEKLKSVLEKANEHMYALLATGDIYWFFKGGRISRTAYLAGSLLKVVPIVTFEDGQLDKDNIVKTRGFDKAYDKLADMVATKGEALEAKGIPFKYIVLVSSDEKYTTGMAEALTRRTGITEDQFIFTALSAEQTAHLGPGSAGTAIQVSLKDLIE